MSEETKEPNTKDCDIEVKSGRFGKCCHKESKFREALDILVWVLFYFLFIYIGGLIINAIEKQHDIDTKTEKRKSLEKVLKKYNLSADSVMMQEIIWSVVEAHDSGGVDFSNISAEIPSSWSIAASVFFCSTVVTTIGYGNIVPVTDGGKVFTIFYAIFGIPFTGIVLAKIGGVFTKFIKKFDDFLAVHVRRGVGKFEQNELKIKLYIRISQLIFTIIIIILFFWIIPAAIMVATEEWNYLDSVYFCFISLTTIGLGDIVPSTSTRHVEFKTMGSDGAKSVTIQITTLLYLLSGLAMLTIVISLGTSLANIIAESAMERAEGFVANNGMNLVNNIKQKASSIAPLDLPKFNKSKEKNLTTMVEREMNIHHESTSSCNTITTMMEREMKQQNQMKSSSNTITTMMEREMKQQNQVKSSSNTLNVKD